MAPITIARRAFQVFFVLAAATLTFKLLRGVQAPTVEYYCPMGGVVSLWGLVKKQQFICALSEMNLSLALTVFAGVLLSKKSFCSWVCPLGTIFEALSWLRGKVMRRESLRVPDRADAFLGYVKYGVLALIIVLSYRASELVFRGYDPFYTLFTAGKGHGLIATWSLVILGGVLVGTFLFEMAWCRYLCPLGAVMNPLSKIGLLKVRRHGDACTGCGVCDRACLQRIPVSKATRVSDMACTNCLSCVSKCKTRGAMDLGV
jgi:polyferredoxin